MIQPISCNPDVLVTIDLILQTVYRPRLTTQEKKSQRKPTANIEGKLFFFMRYKLLFVCIEMS